MKRIILPCISLCLLSLALAACSDSETQAKPVALSASPPSTDSSEGPTSSAGELADADIEAYRAELLDIAFAVASQMPLRPHLKPRSRAQEQVVDTALELGQARRALGYIGQIENWRRGAAYAQLAIHCIQAGDRGEHVDQFLDRAHVEAEAPEDEIGQSWRRDRIKARLAQAYSLLGRTSQSLMFRSELENDAAARVAVFEAGYASDQQFDALIAVLDQAVEIGDFSMIQYALEASKALYTRFYELPVRRQRIEERAELYWRAAPFGLRIDVLLSFAQTAVDVQDLDHASALLARTSDEIQKARWTVLDYAPVMARLAVLFHGVGDRLKADAALRAALERFEAERDELWNFERATALRPIAEAQVALGDRNTALATYRRALEEGAENPNARPRAEDLAATCCSMARAGLAPDAELFQRIREIQAGLTAPW